MGRACLVQHGCCCCCYNSVLDTNMAAAFYTHAAVLFSCHAVLRGYLSMCHAATTLEGFCLLYSNNTKQITLFIKMLVVLASTCFPTMLHCRRRWSFVMIYGHFSWLFSSACEGLHPSNCGRMILLCMTHCFYVHAYWKCTTVYMHFSSISNDLCQKGLKPQNANNLSLSLCEWTE